MTYYDKEMAQLGTHAACMKLENDQGHTRWMTVTPEQIQAILAILNETNDDDETYDAWGVNTKNSFNTKRA